MPNNLSHLIMVVVCRIFCDQLSPYSIGSKVGVQAKSSESARRTVANAVKNNRTLTFEVDKSLG
jgi:hypothetical protein